MLPGSSGIPSSSLQGRASFREALAHPTSLQEHADFREARNRATNLVEGIVMYDISYQSHHHTSLQ